MVRRYSKKGHTRISYFLVDVYKTESEKRLVLVETYCTWVSISMVISVLLTN